MSGKGTDQIDAEYSERFLPFWRKKLGLSENDGIIIEDPKDIRDILKDYYQFILSKTEEEPPEQEYLDLCNLQVALGFTMIWGAPDYLKTAMACAMANDAFSIGQRVVYIDSENKVEKHMLSRGIYYVPGTAKTSQVVRKLATNGLFDLYIFDTIYAMSDYEPTLRSLVKHGRPSKVRYILINQTRVDFGTGKKVPAGADTISEFSCDSYRVVKKGGAGTFTFAKLNNGMHFYFNAREDRLMYDRHQSRFLAMVNNADIVKLGKEYKYAGRLMRKADIIAEWQQQERSETSSRISSSRSSALTGPSLERQGDPEPSAETPTSTEPDSP